MAYMYRNGSKQIMFDFLDKPEKSAKMRRSATTSHEKKIIETETTIRIRKQKTITKVVPNNEDDVSRPSSSNLNLERSAMYSEMIAHRNILVGRHKVKPSSIYTDTTLFDLCSAIPLTKDNFIAVTGIGTERTFDRYGQGFLDIIKKHVSCEPDRLRSLSERYMPSSFSTESTSSVQRKKKAPIRSMTLNKIL